MIFFSLVNLVLYLVCFFASRRKSNTKFNFRQDTPHLTCFLILQEKKIRILKIQFDSPYGFLCFSLPNPGSCLSPSHHLKTCHPLFFLTGISGRKFYSLCHRVNSLSHSTATSPSVIDEKSVSAIKSRLCLSLIWDTGVREELLRRKLDHFFSHVLSLLTVVWRIRKQILFDWKCLVVWAHKHVRKNKGGVISRWFSEVGLEI